MKYLDRLYFEKVQKKIDSDFDFEQLSIDVFETYSKERILLFLLAECLEKKIYFRLLQDPTLVNLDRVQKKLEDIKNENYL